jgi:hypothetical protein
MVGRNVFPAPGLIMESVKILSTEAAMESTAPAAGLYENVVFIKAIAPTPGFAGGAGAIDRNLQPGHSPLTAVCAKIEGQRGVGGELGRLGVIGGIEGAVRECD